MRFKVLKFFVFSIFIIATLRMGYVYIQNQKAEKAVFGLGPTVVIYEPYAGLGNQLFQYAAAYALSKRLKAPLLMLESKNLFHLNDQSTSSRNVMAPFFNLKYDGIVKLYQKRYFKEKIVILNDLNFFETLAPNKIYIPADWFESELYFHEVKEDIRKILDPSALPRRPSCKVIEEEINNKLNSCFVHIRRGDFGPNSLPLSYHEKAMGMMKQKFSNVHFFIFSDDAKFIAETYKGQQNITLVSNGTLNSLEEFYLMTRCRHAIIANSTFSWWAAYLRKDYGAGQVIAPFPRFPQSYFTHEKKELNDFRMSFYFNEETNHAYPKEWIKIKL